MGWGWHLLPDFLAENEIAQGRLALAMEGAAVSLGEYFLVWPADHAEEYPLIKFREWLLAAAGGGPDMRLAKPDPSALFRKCCKASELHCCGGGTGSDPERRQ